MSSPKALTSTAPATDPIDDRWREVGRAIRRLAPKVFGAALFAHETFIESLGRDAGRRAFAATLATRARAEMRAAASPRRRASAKPLDRRPAAASARRGAR